MESNAPSYDVFLSHNSADKPAVEAIAIRLRNEAGLRAFLDKWHLTPGKSWQRELSDALDSSATIAVFFGPDGQGPWHNQELQRALNHAVRSRDEYRIIPVLLPGAAPEQIDGFLELRTWVDFRTGLDDEAAWERLLAGIRGVAPDESDYELPDDPRPYRGLARFESDDHQFYFGRTPDIERLLDSLKTNHFVAVVGASGSGKSSLVRAGLSTDVAHRLVPGIRDWQRITVLPSDDPLRQLATALVAHLPVEQRPALVDTYRERFARHEPDALMTCLGELFPNPSTPVLIVVDQLEELFTHRPATPGQQTKWRQHTDAFAANLRHIGESQAPWLRVVVTLRGDFIDECIGVTDLRELLERRQFWLGEMSEADLREAIVEPARKRGAFFEKGLVETILRDMRGQGGALPLLEESLAALWSARRGPWLTIDAYQNSGGVGGALADKADRIYNSLSDDDQSIARRLFLGLIQLGEGNRDTRRRAHLPSLYGASEAAEDVARVIQRFSTGDSRLISLSTDDGHIDTVEVTHEALIDHWAMLHDWLDGSRDDIRFYRRVAEAARDWDSHGRPHGSLWRPPNLDQLAELHRRVLDAETMIGFGATELDFLLESKRADDDRLEHETRQRKRLMQLTVAACCAAIIALGLFGWAVTQRSEAITAKEDADLKRTDAVEARQAESDALSVSNQDRIRAEESARIANQQRNLAMESIGTLIEEVQEQLTDASSHHLKEQLLNTAMEGLEKLSSNLQSGRINDSDADLLMAKARMRLGDTYQLLGKSESAHQEYLTAQSILARLQKEEQTVEARETQIAVLHNLGDVSSSSEALVFYEQAMTVANEDPPSQDATRATCFAKLGKGQYANAMPDQAVETTRRGLDLLENANHGERGDDERVRIAKLYIQLGAARHAMGDFNVSLTEYSRAREILEQVIAGGSERVDVKIALAEVFEHTSRSTVSFGDPSKAIVDLSQAIKIYQELAQTDSKNAEFLANLARVEMTVGEILVQAGEHGLATVRLDSARRYYNQLSEADPGNANYNRSQVNVLSRLGDVCFLRDGLPGAMRYYNLALDEFDALPDGDQQRSDPFLHAHLVRQLSRVKERWGNEIDAAQIQQRLGSIELRESAQDIGERRELLDAYRAFVILKTKVGDHANAVLHSRTMVELAEELHNAKAISASLLAFSVGEQGVASLAAGDHEFGRSCFMRMLELDDSDYVRSPALISLAWCAEQGADPTESLRHWNQVAEGGNGPYQQIARFKTQQCERVLRVLKTPQDVAAINQLDWETSMLTVLAAASQEDRLLFNALIKRMANSAANDPQKLFGVASCLSRAAQIVEKEAGEVSDVKRNELVQQYIKTAVKAMDLAIRSGFCSWHALSSDPNMRQLRKSSWYSDRRQQATTNSIDMSFALIQAGRFVQGSKLSPAEIELRFPLEKEAYFVNQQPTRAVEISKPFFMGVTEVTVGQFRHFAEERGYVTDAERQVGGAGDFNPTAKGEVDPNNWTGQ